MNAEVVMQLCLAALGGGVVAYLAFAVPARARATTAEKRCLAAEQDARSDRDAREAEARERAAVAATLDTERRSHQARIDEIEGKINEKFAALAADALGKNSETFLRLVSERFDLHRVAAAKALQDRQTAIETLVKPIGESLTRFEGRVAEIEKAREGAYQAITEQVKNLSEGQPGLKSETRRLVQALRQPKTRGRWGEYRLQNVLEMAGMSEHVDFFSEHSMQGEEGKLRPDVKVRLPGGKFAIIDAKTPLDGYLAAFEAGEDEEARETALRNHARHVRQHVSNLASKEYWNALPGSPDFVVMFVPGEALDDAAARMDPAIVEHAIEHRVLIATPTTLIALLKAIAFGWQQEKLTENAQMVADQGRELYGRIQVFGRHMGKLGQSLRQAVDRYNRSVGSLESRVLPSARRFESLGAAPEGAAIAPVEPVSLKPRSLQASGVAAGPGKLERPRVPKSADKEPVHL